MAVEDAKSHELTRDSLGDGAITLLQRRDGYRYGLDAVLLATDLPDLPPSPRIVELGAGQGAVSIAVASRYPDAKILAVERRASLCELLTRNIALNDMEDGDRVTARRADLRDHREVFEPHSADLVLTNPPYYPAGDRRPPADDEKADARHERHGTLADFIDAAAYILDQRGYLKLVIPPLRLDDLFRALRETDLSVDSLRFYHSRADKDAYLTECVARRGGASDMAIRPPLIVYGDSGDAPGRGYGPEVRRRLNAIGNPAEGRGE